MGVGGEVGNPPPRREENVSARMPDSTLMLGYPSLCLWGRSTQNTGICLPALQLTGELVLGGLGVGAGSWLRLWPAQAARR